jgi:hypothetical protein
MLRRRIIRRRLRCGVRDGRLGMHGACASRGRAADRSGRARVAAAFSSGIGRFRARYRAAEVVRLIAPVG